MISNLCYNLQYLLYIQKNQHAHFKIYSTAISDTVLTHPARLQLAVGDP